MKEKYVFFGLSVMSMVCALIGFYTLQVSDNPPYPKSKVILYFLMSAGFMILYLRWHSNDNDGSDGQLA